MSIGWKTNKKSPKTTQLKIPVENRLEDFTFWETAKPPASPLSSESQIDLNPPEVKTFKVVSVVKTARFDKIEGENKETLFIYGDWREGTPRIGNTVSIIPCLCCPKSSANLNTLTNTSNYMIIHAKKSLVATNIIESLECVRKAILLDRIAEFNRSITKPLVYGVIIHEWVDILIKNRTTSISVLAKELKRIISKYIISLSKIKIIPTTAFTELFKYFGVLKGFIETLEYEKSEESKTVHSQLLQLKGKPDLIVLNKNTRTEIELKTGKSLYTENIAQVILYALLQKEQKGYTSQRLFHLTTNSVREINLNHQEVIHILQKRNKMVRENKLPKRKEIAHCERCTLNGLCKNTSRIEEMPLFDSLEQIKKGDFSGNIFRYIWEEIDKEEEKSKESPILGVVDTWDNNYLKIIVIEAEATGLFCGEFIRVYDKELCAFGTGIITAVNSGIVEIHLHERLVYKHNGSIFIARDYSPKAFAELRSSLLTLFSSEKVKSMWMGAQTQKHISIPSPFVGEFLELNTNQQNALFSALQNSPYTLIHGMPGTGKTRVISLLIKILASEGKSVLVCCHTHLSLSNIEKNLLEFPFINIYRTGRTKIEQFNRDIDENFDIKENENYDIFKSYNVVLSTTRAIFSDPIFGERQFDMYIADEATQQNFLCSVIPSEISKSIVLIGDHLQLQPLAKTECLKLSLFEILRGRSKMNTLSVQYRMPQSIMDLSNKMFYNRKMKCKSKVTGSVSFMDGVDTCTVENTIRKANSSTQILCYFNEQVRKVRLLGKDAETVDRFQGSEAEDVLLIIDALVDGSPKEEILTAPQRLNVALTRSKSTLFIIGIRKHLEKYAIFNDLFKHIQDIKQ